MKIKDNPRVAVIGGSGVYEMEGISDLKEVKLKTPFGNPSDAIVVGTLSGVKCAFLPRHGRGHRILPTEVNSRANMWALKKLGVEQIIAISACGSLKEEVRPKDFLIPDQLFDRTRSRPYSFFGEGIVGHVSFAEPYCGILRRVLVEASREIRVPVHDGGTFVIIEGPTFSTKAESKVFRDLGFSIVGMTNLPEAKLAREAEICFATVGLVTDYDVWREGEEVTVDRVIANLTANVSNVKRLIKTVLPKLPSTRICACGESLKHALMTAPSAMRSAARKRLDLFLGKYLKK